ncbi:MAG: helicase-related protein, partial [Mycoplasma sp.]
MIYKKLIFNDSNNIFNEFEKIHKNEGIIELNCYVGYSNFFTIMKVLKIFEKSSEQIKVNIYYSVNVSQEYRLNSNFLYRSELKNSIIPYVCLDILQSYISYLKNIKLPNNVSMSYFRLESQMIMQSELSKIYHGKVFEIKTNQNNYVIIGSSNLTHNGISPIQPKNSDHYNYLNEISGVFQNNEISGEFESWKKHLLEESFKPNSVSDLMEFKTSNIYDLLYTIYEDLNDLEDISNTTAIDTFKKNSFVFNEVLKDNQKKTVEKLLKSMIYFGGGILNYDVGLGKTLVAIAIFDFFRNYMNRKDITILVPSRLSDDWISYSKLHYSLKNLQNHVKKFSEIENVSTSDILIIDEAHNFRNYDTSKRRKLIENYFCDDIDWSSYKYKEIEDKNLYERIPQNSKYGKMTLLITATPISNSEKDLINIIELFGVNINKQKNILEKIESLTKKQWCILKWINPANKINNVDEKEVREYINFFFNRNNKKELRYSPLKKPSEYYFPIIKNIGDEHVNPCVLSEREVDFIKWLNSEDNKLDLDTTKKWTEDFRKFIEKVYENDLFSSKGKSLLKINLYCALDSSFDALISTIDITIKRIENCLKHFNKIGIDKYSQLWKKYSSTESYIDEDLLEDDELIFEDSEHSFCDENDRMNYYCLPKFLIDHKSSSMQKKWNELILNEWVNLKKEFNKINSDSVAAKFHFLKFLFDEKNKKIDKLNERKTIIFAQRKATVKNLAKWISDNSNDFHLNNGEGIIAASSEGFDIYYKENDEIIGNFNINEWHYKNNESYSNIVKKMFAEISNKEIDIKDIENNNLYKEYKIKRNINFKFLITTNIYAEGHNLQDATILINYDAHYNPTVTLQRIGRVDRYRDYETKFTDSIYNHVFIFNLYTNSEIMKVITTYEKQKSKTLIADVLGSDSHKFYIPQEGVANYENKMEMIAKETEKLEADELNDVMQLHNISEESRQEIKSDNFIKYRIVNSKENGVLIKFTTLKGKKHIVFMKGDCSVSSWPKMDVFEFWNDKDMQDIDLLNISENNIEKIEKYNEWLKENSKI